MHGHTTLEIGGVRWWLRAGLEPAALAPLLERALGAAADAADLRSGRRKRLFRLALAGRGESDHLLKRNADPAARALVRRVFGSKARRELAIAQALAERGVPVVVPLAAGERRRSAALAESFLLVPLVAGARDLRERWRDPALAPGERRRLIAALGRLVRRAHDAGLDQQDLAPNNVLVCGASGELVLVDFERARLRGVLPAGARRRALAKLARFAGALPASQRLRFLRAYAGEAGDVRRWWRSLCDEAPRLARRDDTRLRRVAARAGRRFDPVADAGWRGYARRGERSWLARLERAPAPAQPRLEAGGELWCVTQRPLSRRRARTLWARANTLAGRGLAPAPLALLGDGERTLLLFAPPAGVRPRTQLPSDAARAALAKLLAELLALGELREAPALDAVAFVVGRAGRLRALLAAPHAFEFSGRAGDERSREHARRLLASLAAASAGAV